MCRHIIYKKCLSNVVFNLWKLFSRFYSKKWPSKKSNYAKKNRLKILYRMPYSKNRDLFSRTNFDHFRFSSKIWKTRICGGWIEPIQPSEIHSTLFKQRSGCYMILYHMTWYHTISYDNTWCHVMSSDTIFGHVLDMFQKSLEGQTWSFSKKFRGPLGYVLASSVVSKSRSTIQKSWSKIKKKVLLRSSRIVFELIWAKNQIQSSVLALIYGFFHIFQKIIFLSAPLFLFFKRL